MAMFQNKICLYNLENRGTGFIASVTPKRSNNLIMSDRGLLLKNINEDWLLALDPENVFWGVLPKTPNGEFILPESLIEMYNQNRDELDKQMSDFRFGIDLNCIYIDPTDRCNADCPYCYIPPAIRKGGVQMTYEQLDAILQKITVYFEAKKKKPVIVFHAAEPLLVKDILFKAIEKYHQSLLFGIQTNALLLEQSDVEFMKKYRVGVGISLDSSVRDINNISRASGNNGVGGGGNFQSAIKAIDWFDGYAGLNVICTVSKHNAHKLSELVQFLHSKHISCVLLNPVRTTRNQALKIKATDKEFYHGLVSAVEKAMELTVETGQQIIIGNFANIILSIVSPMARRMMCDISPCGGGRTFITIAANGDILPCGEFTGFRSEFSGGNIFDTSIDDALNSEPFHKVRSRKVERISECKDCGLRNICGSPCPAEMHGRGDIYQKAEFCDFYKEIIMYAFKLIAQNKLGLLLRKDSLEQMEFEYKLPD